MKKTHFLSNKTFLQTHLYYREFHYFKFKNEIIEIDIDKQDCWKINLRIMERINSSKFYFIYKEIKYLANQSDRIYKLQENSKTFNIFSNWINKNSSLLK